MSSPRPVGVARHRSNALAPAIADATRHQLDRVVGVTSLGARPCEPIPGEREVSRPEVVAAQNRPTSSPAGCAVPDRQPGLLDHGEPRDSAASVRRHPDDGLGEADLPLELHRHRRGKLLRARWVQAGDPACVSVRPAGRERMRQGPATAPRGRHHVDVGLLRALEAPELVQHLPVRRPRGVREVNQAGGDVVQAAAVAAHRRDCGDIVGEVPDEGDARAVGRPAGRLLGDLLCEAAPAGPVGSDRPERVPIETLHGDIGQALGIVRPGRSRGVLRACESRVDAASPRRPGSRTACARRRTRSSSRPETSSAPIPRLPTA